MGDGYLYFTESEYFVQYPVILNKWFWLGDGVSGRIGVGANILKKIITKLDIHVYSNFVHHSSFNIIQCTKDNCLKTDTHS